MKTAPVEGDARASVRLELPPMNRQRKAPSGVQGMMSGRRPIILAVCAVGALWLLSSLFSSSSAPTISPQQVQDMPETQVRVDMHSHSTESDGDRTAEEQIRLARKMGMRNLWITDHDMIRDLRRTHELQEVGRREGVTVGFGVEITVGWLKKEHHLLGYFPDSAWARKQLTPEMVALQEACAKVKESRETRNKNLVNYLNDLLGSAKGKVYFDSPAAAAAFKPLDIPTVSAWAKEYANLLEPTSLGRPHFSKYLMTQRSIRKDMIFGPRDGDGYGTLTADDRVLFGEDRDGVEGTEIEALMHSATLARRNIAFDPLPIEDAIRLIKAAGGRAVIAHLPTLGPGWDEKFPATFPDLVRAGLWGLEAWSSEIDLDNHLKIHALADRYGLQLTGGSDNHGTLKTYAVLGQVHHDGAELYEQLNDWAKQGVARSNSLLDL